MFINIKNVVNAFLMAVCWLAYVIAMLPIALVKVAARIPAYIKCRFRRNNSVSDEESGWFWDIIAISKCNREMLYNVLRKMDKHEIIRFQHCFISFASALKTPQHTTLRHEDCVNDICHWVVSQGRSVYLIVLDNPEMMPMDVSEHMDKILYGVADRLFYKKYNRPISLNK